jgi:hypothetical protein
MRFLRKTYNRYKGLCIRCLRTHGIFLTTNDRKVAALKDKHQGRRCFIIGSGPSLKIADLDRLKNEITFACNKIYLAFGDTEWRPTYYSVYDILVAENNRSTIDELDLFKIFGENIRPYFEEESAVWLRALDVPIVDGDYRCRFSTNALDGLYGGWTVIYLQMQLAFHMGIREIYLIGVDFSFEIPKTTGETCSSGEILKHQGELNHFHPEYRKPGETWTMPLLDLQHKAFLEAKRTIELQGGKILNASRKTELDVFPLVDFDDIAQ